MSCASPCLSLAPMLHCQTDGLWWQACLVRQRSPPRHVCDRDCCDTDVHHAQTGCVLGQCLGRERSRRQRMVSWVPPSLPPVPGWLCPGEVMSPTGDVGRKEGAYWHHCLFGRSCRSSLRRWDCAVVKCAYI